MNLMNNESLRIETESNFLYIIDIGVFENFNSVEK